MPLHNHFDRWLVGDREETLDLFRAKEAHFYAGRTHGIKPAIRPTEVSYLISPHGAGIEPVFRESYFRRYYPDG